LSGGGHWQRVWSRSEPGELSWFEAEPAASLQMVDSLDLRPDSPIVDVGGGASGLAGELLRRGFSDVTVADVSVAALSRARADLGADADRIHWVEADVTTHDFGRRFAVWHDRAMFHFLVEPADRDRYVNALARSLQPGGHAIIATFGPAGPTACSGLPTARYDADELAAALAPAAALVSCRLEVHATPGGNDQQFLYAVLKAHRHATPSIAEGDGSSQRRR
jgi:SAM-dependent methyltransferase